VFFFRFSEDGGRFSTETLAFLGIKTEPKSVFLCWNDWVNVIFNLVENSAKFHFPNKPFLCETEDPINKEKIKFLCCKFGYGTTLRSRVQ